MERLKMFYFDLETGGLDSKKSPILQFAGKIEVNGIEVEEVEWFIKPPDWKLCDPVALDINGIYKKWEENPELFVTEQEFYEQLLKLLNRYINRFDKLDKFYLVGYNSHAFDAQFLRALFLAYNNNFFGSYFWNPSVDVMLLAMAACIGQRHNLGDFKLATVAQSLGIKVDPNRLHDGMYDIELTREIFQILKESLNLTE